MTWQCPFTATSYLCLAYNCMFVGRVNYFKLLPSIANVFRLTDESETSKMCNFIRVDNFFIMSVCHPM